MGGPQGYPVVPGLNQLGPFNDALQQKYLQDRLKLLEIPMSQAERLALLAKLTGYYRGLGMGGDMTDEQALDAIWQARPDLADFYRSNGWNVDSPEQQRAAVRNWIESADPQWKGMTPQQVAQKLGGGDGLGFEAVGPGEGALPTFEREQWNEANKQYWGGLYASMRGPEDWALRQSLNPLGSFGYVAPVRSHEQNFADFWNKNVAPGQAPGGVSERGGSQQLPPGGAPPGQGFRAPGGEDGSEWLGQGKYDQNQYQNWLGWGDPGQGPAPGQPGYVPPPRQVSDLTWGEFRNWTPTQRAMERGKWSYWGMDPGDMETYVQRAAPTGWANPNTRWA